MHGGARARATASSAQLTRTLTHVATQTWPAAPARLCKPPCRRQTRNVAGCLGRSALHQPPQTLTLMAAVHRAARDRRVQRCRALSLLESARARQRCAQMPRTARAGQNHPDAVPCAGAGRCRTAARRLPSSADALSASGEFLRETSCSHLTCAHARCFRAAVYFVHGLHVAVGRHAPCAACGVR